jgi:hypothetical protein
MFDGSCLSDKTKIKLNSVALVSKQAIPNERPPLIGKFNAKIADSESREVGITNAHDR